MLTKAETRYTDHGSQTEHCSICTHFHPPDKCAIVAGDVRPGGWCNHFHKAPKQVASSAKYVRGKG